MVTDEGVAAVVSRLQAYSARINGVVESLPPEPLAVPQSNGLANGNLHEASNGIPADASDEEASGGMGASVKIEMPPS